MAKKATDIEEAKLAISQDYKLLYADACAIIEDARDRAYRAVNVSLTLRNWQLGERIAKDELDGAERAEYGKRVITTLAHDLTAKYGKGFDRSTLYRYLLFYRMFPGIVAAVRPQLEILGAMSPESGKVDAVSQPSQNVAAVRPKLLPWTHYRELIRVENPEARAWYEQEAHYSVLHGSEQLFQAKYLTYLPTKEELTREIELQKEIFRQQKEAEDEV